MIPQDDNPTTEHTMSDHTTSARQLALDELGSYADDHEAATDQRIIIAIRILEGEPNAIAASRLHRRNQTTRPQRQLDPVYTNWAHVDNSFLGESMSGDEGELTGAALHQAVEHAIETGGSPKDFEWYDQQPLGGGWEPCKRWRTVLGAAKVRKIARMRHLVDARGVRHEWPEPMREAPPHETNYWVPNPEAPSLVTPKRWQKGISTGYDIEMGIAHLRKKDAQAQSKAWIAASAGAAEE